MKNIKVYFLSGNNYHSVAETINSEILGLSLFGWIEESLDVKGEIIGDLPAKTGDEISLILRDSVPHVTVDYIQKAIDYMIYRDKPGMKIPGGYLLAERFEGDFSALEKYEGGAVELNEIEDLNGFYAVSKILSLRHNARLMKEGVIIEDCATAFIDKSCRIEKGAVISAFNVIKGETVIKSGAKLYPYNSVESSVIGENCSVRASTLNCCSIEKGTVVGPYAYLRPGTKVGSGCRIGDFVEIKNANIGDGTKVSHLAYVGDADIGENCNIGCGTVFANYNGKEKFRSVVGDGVFIGCNSNIVAPVAIGDGCYIAAGTTLCENMKENGFAIGRSRCTIKENGAEKYK